MKKSSESALYIYTYHLCISSLSTYLLSLCCCFSILSDMCSWVETSIGCCTRWPMRRRAGGALASPPAGRPRARAHALRIGGIARRSTTWPGSSRVRASLYLSRSATHDALKLPCRGAWSRLLTGAHEQSLTREVRPPTVRRATRVSIEWLYTTTRSLVRITPPTPLPSACLAAVAPSRIAVVPCDTLTSVARATGIPAGRLAGGGSLLSPGTCRLRPAHCASSGAFKRVVEAMRDETFDLAPISIDLMSRPALAPCTAAVAQ